jgi:predicted 2-oxoglutarate/Fe(II)-dependent dioxygenase YbiX
MLLYKAKFPLMESNKINQIDLLKYDVGGKYEIHTDHFSTSPRHLSIIINLNDDYEGGDLVFTDQQEKEVKRLKLGKGSIVFFPSNFMYPHGIQPITKGTRYSIVAWLQ